MLTCVKLFSYKFQTPLHPLEVDLYVDFYLAIQRKVKVLIFDLRVNAATLCSGVVVDVQCNKQTLPLHNGCLIYVVV